VDVSTENTTQNDVNVGEDGVRNRFGRGAKSGSTVDQSSLHKSTMSLSTEENIPNLRILHSIVSDLYHLYRPFLIKHGFTELEIMMAVPISSNHLISILN